MQFNVPGAVLARIAEYDPATPKSKKKKSNGAAAVRNTLGVVNDLIPFDLVPAETQQRLALELNRLTEGDRCRTLNTDQVHAVVFVHRGVWCSVWHPKDSNSPYLFGLSVAYKSSESSLKRVGTLQTGFCNPDYANLEQIAPHTSVKYGRTAMRKHTATITQDDLIKWGAERLPIGSILSSGSWNKKNAVEAIIRSAFASKSLLAWNNCGDSYPFRRLLDIHNPLGILDRIFSPAGKGSISTLPEYVERLFPNLRNVLATPYFKRELGQFYADLVRDISDPKFSREHDLISRLRNLINTRCISLSAFVEVYGDTNMDYCQQVWKSDCAISYNHWSDPRIFIEGSRTVLNWLRDNVPVASFVNMAVSCGKSGEFADTLQMMGRVVAAGGTIPKPKRWRLTELHDAASEESYKLNKPNIDLPQDLFPKPVKAGPYTFFQPNDTHQLAKWGRAVRNCVGNSGHYAEQVKKKRQFIVLALEGKDPRFTIQLKVEDGVMTVVQIVGMCNDQLSDTEKASYTKAFGEALKIRERELAQAA